MMMMMKDNDDEEDDNCTLVTTIATRRTKQLHTKTIQQYNVKTMTAGPQPQQ